VTTTLRIVLPPPDRRYWRRRANRRVRKRRLLRGAVRVAGVCLVNGCIGVIVLYVVVLGARALTRAPEFAVRRIEVEGRHRAPAGSIEARLAGLSGNLLELDLDAAAAAAAGDPWVASAAAKRILPDTLRVTVVEREPCAIAVVDDVPVVVDATGAVIGRSGPDLPDDLPVLTGLDRLRGAARDAALARGASRVDVLRRSAPQWLAGLSELDVAAADRIVARTIEPGPRLVLDPQDVGRNVGAYLDLRREIERRVGPLAYVDLRWQGRIAVMPAPPDSETTREPIESR
jgi:cell division septal protein FtsQ